MHNVPAAKMDARREPKEDRCDVPPRPPRYMSSLAVSPAPSLRLLPAPELVGGSLYLIDIGDGVFPEIDLERGVRVSKSSHGLLRPALRGTSPSLKTPPVSDPAAAPRGRLATRLPLPSGRALPVRQVSGASRRAECERDGQTAGLPTGSGGISRA